MLRNIIACIRTRNASVRDMEALDNPLSNLLSWSLLCRGRTAPRKLKRWERLLLWLGF